MAMLPTGYVVKATNGGVYTTVVVEKSYGGTVMGVTDATVVTGRKPTVTKVMQYDNQLRIGGIARSITQAVSGAAHTYSAQKAYTSGTFAYDPRENEYIMQRYTVKINGSTALASILSNTGQPFPKPKTNNKYKFTGYKYSTAVRAGYLRFSKVSGTASANRTMWSTAPSAANESFINSTGSSLDGTTAALSDQGMFVTYRAIPGELTYLAGSLTPVLGDYSAHNL